MSSLNHRPPFIIAMWLFAAMVAVACSDVSGDSVYQNPAFTERIHLDNASIVDGLEMTAYILERSEQSTRIGYTVSGTFHALDIFAGQPVMVLPDGVRHVGTSIVSSSRGFAQLASTFPALPDDIQSVRFELGPLVTLDRDSPQIAIELPAAVYGEAADAGIGQLVVADAAQYRFTQMVDTRSPTGTGKTGSDTLLRYEPANDAARLRPLLFNGDGRLLDDQGREYKAETIRWGRDGGEFRILGGIHPDARELRLRPQALVVIHDGPWFFEINL